MDETQSDDGCFYSTLLKTICSLETNDSGTPIRKCQKTQQLLRKCVGRPQEVVDSKVDISEENASLRLLAPDLKAKPGELWPKTSWPGDRSVEFPFRGIFESRGPRFSGALEDFVQSAGDSVVNAFASFDWSEDQPAQQSPAPAVPRGGQFSWFTRESGATDGNRQNLNSQEPSNSQKKPDYESFNIRIQEV